MKRGCLRHAADLKRGNIERVREMRDKKRKKVKLYDRWSRKLRKKKKVRRKGKRSLLGQIDCEDPDKSME
jgi:hypothetical protein